MSARASIRVAGIVAVSVLLPASCGEDPTGPDGGRITYSLATPFTDDGGVVVAVTVDRAEVAAPGTQCPQCQLYSREAGGELRLMIVGNLTNGPLFSLNASRGASQVRILDAAARDGTPRSPRDYSVTADR